MSLIIICCLCLLTLCQSKYIEVNNKGNDTIHCCVEGKCLCGSLVEAFLHIQNNAMINITSSISLHNVTHTGSETLNNITVIGSGITVECNSTGSFTCRFCNNVVIQGITWDQCGDPKHPNITHAVGFRSATNVSILQCTFQHSKVCFGVFLPLSSGYVLIQDCKFLFNLIANLSPCMLILKKSSMMLFGSLYILNAEGDTRQNAIHVGIMGTLFYYNGATNYTSDQLDIINHLPTGSVCASLVITLVEWKQLGLYIENLTVSTSFGLGSIIVLHGISESGVLFTKYATFINNSKGGSLFQISALHIKGFFDFKANSCSYAHNINGSLKLDLAGGFVRVELHRLTIVENKGTFMNINAFNHSIDQGSGITILIMSNLSIINISLCNIQGNYGKSIVYVRTNSLTRQRDWISIVSCNFTKNTGSALHISDSTVKFGGSILFINNLAEKGAAVYIDENTQIAIKENSVVEFIGNTASQQGGAIFIDLSFSCPDNGIVFIDLANTSSVSFINNSADKAGNSIYFSIPSSCNVIGESLAYMFNYTQIPELIGPPLATSPHKINLCSTSCSDTNNTCHVRGSYMLGQPIDTNATVCDYFDSISETVQFYADCTNCNITYRLSKDKILVHHGLFDVTFLAIDSDSDIVDNTNVTLSLYSVSSNEHRQLIATLSMELSPCHSGYVFDSNVQQCVCYEQSQDIIQCQQDYAEIKYGYWFGVISFTKRTVSLCPFYYCKYNTHALTSSGYYKLPEELNDQCSSHRTGVACSECKSGYTLTYDSPNCINTENCSVGMKVLVITLTILYWIIVVALVFGLMQHKVSLGYAYGLIYYYSVIDLMLGNNLFISDGVFQLVTVLSSFAKLTPQFLGNICFIQGLSGIDQLFIHYFHAISVSLLIGAIVIAARYSFKIAKVVSHCIIRVICLLILLSYTSLASTSLQLLRPLYFDDVNGAYVYSSPSIKYFTGRHILYGIIALLCGLFIVIGLPLLLLLEPFLNHKINFIKIKPLLDQYQQCYKDQYHWFAACYLVYRQVIIAIIYISNFSNALYYLQTACIIIVSIHIWIQPYEIETLNVLDGIILLTIVLVINLNSFIFSRTTTITIVVIMVIFPLFYSCLIYGRKIYSFIKHESKCYKPHT